MRGLTSRNLAGNALLGGERVDYLNVLMRKDINANLDKMKKSYAASEPYADIFHIDFIHLEIVSFSINTSISASKVLP